MSLDDLRLSACIAPLLNKSVLLSCKWMSSTPRLLSKLKGREVEYTSIRLLSHASMLLVPPPLTINLSLSQARDYYHIHLLSNIHPQLRLTQKVWPYSGKHNITALKNTAIIFFTIISPFCTAKLLYSFRVIKSSFILSGCVISATPADCPEWHP